MEDSPAATREKKAALLGVIELQRKLIQQQEEAELAGGGSSGVLGAGTTSADAELQWYKEQASRLEKFKVALNVLRLQPDQFAVLMPLHWAAGEGQSPRRPRHGATRVPYVLRINARSQLTFVPKASVQGSHHASGALGCLAEHSCGESGEEAGSSGEPPAALEPSDAVATRAHVYFMDMLRHVRTTSTSAGTAGGAAGAGGTTAAIDAVEFCWKAEASLLCVAPEAEELAESVGAHLRRYNQSRVATLERLKAVHALKCTPYSSANAEHEKLLQRLWACGFPGVPLQERVSEHWLHLGFQGTDPATDFRGMGILGLSNLVYFGEQYPEVFQRLVSAQGKRDYPLACAGINVTSMLCEMLNMKDDGHPEQVQRRPPFSEEWDSDMLTFFCHMFYRERPFDDMYCFSLRALDRMFVLMDADCADFPSVIGALRTRLHETLAQRPLSFREFKRLVNLHAHSDNDSAHSGRESSISGHSAGSSLSDAAPAGQRELGKVLADVFEGLPKGLESAGRATERLASTLAASFRDFSTRVKQ